MNALRLLSARCSMNLDVPVERRLGILQPQVAFAAAEQRHEDLSEILAHLNERREEKLTRSRIDFANSLLKRELCRGEICTLRCQHLETLLLLFMLLDRQRIHGTERIDLLAKLRCFRAQTLVVDLERLDGFHEILERLSPLRLEALANHRATP